MTRPNGETGWKVIDLMVRVLSPVLVAAVIFMAGKVMDVDSRLTAIEANRFTSRDGVELRDLLHTEFTAIRKDIAEIKTTMPREVPPIWLLERVTRIEDRQDVMDKKLDKRNDK